MPQGPGGVAELRLLVDTIPHIVWMAAPDGTTEYFNRQGTDYTGISPETDPGWEWVSLLHPDDAERARHRWVDAVGAGTPLEIEFRIRRADGEFRWHVVRALPVRHGGGEGDGDIISWIGTATDVDDTRRTDELRSAVMDNMVEGLYTLDGDGRVTYLNRAASQMLGWREDELRGKPMHAAIHFQKADGTALPEARCPVLAVRSEGLVVRVADDTFTRMDGTTFPVAYSVAPLHVASAARGVVVVFRDTSADEAGDARIRREAALPWLGRIRDALAEGRFTLYSQPIVRLAGARNAAGVSEELLLRMLGRSGEVILPGNFLPVAEQYGLIGAIDRWVITQAVRRAAGGHHVEANLSASSIGAPGLIGFIERELRTTGADPSNLVFELTETALMANLEAGEAFAHSLVQLGCGLALDDFGTGFGSFIYLKRLPLRYLKIDIEFVRDLVTSPANLHVVRAIVSLALAFGLQTIAEGVEDEETLAILRAEGVDFGQGYHLGRPAPMQPSTDLAPLLFSGLSIDITTRQVALDGRCVRLTNREFDLLAYLAAAPRQVFSRDQLLRHVWHVFPDPERSQARLVTEHVSRIRHKIESDPGRPRWIRTVAGAGYQFEP